MTTLFDKFVKKISSEGVDVDKVYATSALIKASVNNAADSAVRQVHSQCSHTNFKECRKTADEDLDNKLIEELAKNREASSFITAK
jgi:hypothetical protein